MGDKRDQGSKLDQLYHDGGGSKIDQLYGSPQKDDATKAAEAERRVDQRMYREAVRNKDYKAVAAFHAKPGFQAPAGITRHGQYDAQDRKTGENFTQEGQRLYNNGQDINQSANDIERRAGALGTGKGDSPQNAAASSSGGQWVNVGPSATGGAVTPPSASTAPANGNQDARDVLEGAKGLSKLPGESDFDFDERVKQQRGKTEGAYGVDRKAVLAGLKGKFAKQDAARAAADPFATVTPIDPQYQATPEQITEADNESFAKSYGDYLNSDEGKNATREQKDAKYAELKKANPGFRVTDEAREVAASTIRQNRQNVAARIDPFQDTDNLSDPLRDAERLIPGARKELADIETLGSDMEGGLDNYGARKSARKDKERAAKITSGLMAETKPTPSPMDIDNPFRSNKTGFEFTGDIGPAITSQDNQDEKLAGNDDIFERLTAKEEEPDKPIKQESPAAQKLAEKRKKELSGESYFEDFPSYMPEEQRQYYRNSAGKSAGFDTFVYRVLEFLDGSGDDGDSIDFKKEKIKKYNEYLKSNLKNYGHLDETTLQPTTAKVDKEREATSMWG